MSRKNGRLIESWKPVQKVLEYSKEGSGKRVWNRMEGDGTLWKVLERSRGRRNRAAKRALRKRAGNLK